MISPLLVVGIHLPVYVSLPNLVETYMGAAWWCLRTMKCHLCNNYLSYSTIEGLPLLQLRTGTHLNNHHLTSAKTDIQLYQAYCLYSNIITSDFHLQGALLAACSV
jgi:hypothetical protein